MVEYEAIHTLEEALGIQIIIIDGEKLLQHAFPQQGSIIETVHYINEERHGLPQCIMLLDGEHVHFVKSLKSLFAAENACSKCMCTYKNKTKHVCGGDAKHKTLSAYEKPSVNFIRGDDKKCAKRCKKLIAYDIETDTTSDKERHIPNVLCWSLTSFEDSDGTLLKKGTIILGEDSTDVIQDFVTLITTDKDCKDAYVYAHNGGGYDNRFIYKNMIKRGFNATRTFFNGRLYRIFVPKNNLNMTRLASFHCFH